MFWLIYCVSFAHLVESTVDIPEGAGSSPASTLLFYNLLVMPPLKSQIKTLFLQEMFARGILTIGSHNMSFSHTDDDLDQLFSAYNEVIPMLVEGVRHNKLESMLRCQPLQPLFKVRWFAEIRFTIRKHPLMISGMIPGSGMRAKPGWQLWKFLFGLTHL